MQLLKCQFYVEISRSRKTDGRSRSTKEDPLAPRFGMRLDGWMKPSYCVELSVAAEKAGFDAIWHAENPYGRGVIPAMAASMLVTSRIEIGVGVFNPFNRHPTLIAMEMGGLDDLSNGRANLGLGVGVPKVLAKAGLGHEKLIAALRDTVAIVRGLMAGETVHYEGKVFKADGVKLEFEPVRKDYPITIASMGDQSIKMSGEIADNVMISNLCTPGFSARAAELMGEVAHRRKLPKPPRLIQYAPCVARPDRDEARAHAREILGGMILRSFGEGSERMRASHMLGSDLPEDYFMSVHDRLKAGVSAQEVVEDRLLDLYTVSGDADDCRAAYERYLAAGVEEVVVTFRGKEPIPEMAYLADSLNSLRRDLGVETAL